jgi:Asp-tRNA(Asn)/Glu-tRNA(Gln) amidotransferase A subunit family amidase
MCAVLCLQRIRARAMLHFERAFQQCDVIVTPATPRTAPDLPDAVLHGSGTYDLAGTFETIRFTQVIVPAALMADIPSMFCSIEHHAPQDILPFAPRL